MEYVTCPNCGKEMTREYYESQHKYQCYSKEAATSSREWKENLSIILQEAVKDEAKAIKEYNELSNSFKKIGLLDDAKNIMRISEDEGRHQKILSDILYRLQY